MFGFECQFWLALLKDCEDHTHSFQSMVQIPEIHVVTSYIVPKFTFSCCEPSVLLKICHDFV